MLHTVFMVVFWICLIAVLAAMTADLVSNIINFRKSSTKTFVGQPTEVEAVVDEQTMMLIKNRRANSDSMAQQINIISLSYKVDGITFTKEAELVDVMSCLKAGDTVQLVYDSCDYGRALFADEIERISAKNAIKWDIGYYLIALIVGAFLFFTIEGVS